MNLALLLSHRHRARRPLSRQRHPLRRIRRTPVRTASPPTCTRPISSATSSDSPKFAGGIAILTGILIRVGAVCVIIIMLGAIFLVHIQHGFNISAGGAEYAITQLLVATTLLITGAYSLAGVMPHALRKL